MKLMDSEVFGLVKPGIDAHTMGIHAAAELLRACGYRVVIADEAVERAMDHYRQDGKLAVVLDWLRSNKVTRVGISYRLDPTNAVNLMGYLVEELKRNQMLYSQGGTIRAIFFGGLPPACAGLEQEFKGLVQTFPGGESAAETLEKLGVPKERIPRDLEESSGYDAARWKFAEEVIRRQEYQDLAPAHRSGYPEYGTASDSVVSRIQHQVRTGGGPLIRAHVGPYSSEASRKESVDQFLDWTKSLAAAGYLDILSIGTSQLTQSNFGENWDGRPNGGGVPVNSAEEYRQIWEAARPMLVRTYAGTKNIPELAKLHEEHLHICWHALSLWWFNQLDERGPYSLYENLQQHVQTLSYIAQTNKPFEPNVPHHFSFRGGDDVTYIVSAYLSAKLAKKMGVKTLILQNMLNTPRATWGIADLAKSRAMLRLVNELAGPDFHVYLQPRAGLDYFKADLQQARIQLASVTALMDDIDPHNALSPPLIHVVSYSEASHLATPEIINESIRITLQSLKEYRRLRKLGYVEDMSRNQEVEDRTRELLDSARILIAAMEQSVPALYSAEGFYEIFAAGFLPVPYLWQQSDEFKHAMGWKTRLWKGGMTLVDQSGRPISAKDRAEIAQCHQSRG